MKFSVLEEEDGSNGKTENAVTSTEKAKTNKPVKDAIVDTADEKNIGVTSTSAIKSNNQCQKATSNTGDDIPTKGLGKCSDFETLDLQFKTCFDKAPNFAEVSSSTSAEGDDQMDWETKSLTIPDSSNLSVDESVSQPSTSGFLDDSVIICEIRSPGKPSRSTKLKKLGNDSIIEVDEVLVISDTEDESSLQKGKGGTLRNKCNNRSRSVLKRSPLKNEDIICVSSPSITQLCKRRKTETLNSEISIDKNFKFTKPDLTIADNASSGKECTFLGSKSQPELKIVSEVNNFLPLSQTFSRVGCKAKSRRTCKQNQCLVHKNFSGIHTTKSALLQRRNRRRLRSKEKRAFNDRYPFPVSQSTSTNLLITVPDSCSTSERIVKDIGRNSHLEKPSCSHISTSQNKENSAFPKRNSNLQLKKQSRKGSLRPIVVDGSNVAFSHGQKNRLKTFSCRGIELCVKYFQNRGHEVTVFVPQYRRCKSKEIVNQEILERLGDQQVVVFTPSRKVDGVLINSYDDRFIVDLAARTGGVIVSNDNYRDLINEKPEWREAINERLLMYVFVGDHFMVPDDPMGIRGVGLEEFLSFPS